MSNGEDLVEEAFWMKLCRCYDNIIAIIDAPVPTNNRGLYKVNAQDFEENKEYEKNTVHKFYSAIFLQRYFTSIFMLFKFYNSLRVTEPLFVSFP